MEEQAQQSQLQGAQQQSPQVTLTVDINTLNVILAGLDELPARVSRRVQDTLIQQAQAQLQSKPETMSTT